MLERPCGRNTDGLQIVGPSAPGRAASALAAPSRNFPGTVSATVRS